MKIAYQGEPGAYSEAAALRFSPNSQTVPCESFDDVFAAVNDGKTTHGILPIENSIGGSIHRNYDLLLEHELPVVGEVLLQVSHHLLAFPGTKLQTSRRSIRTRRVSRSARAFSRVSRASRSWRRTTPPAARR